MSILPKEIESPLVKIQIEKLNNTFQFLKPNLSPEDIEYATQFIHDISEDYDNGLFDIDEEERKTCSWDKYSYARYGIMDGITGFLSELKMTAIANTKTGKNAFCVMVPDNEEYQLAGIDLVMNYPGHPGYNVSVQVKTGKFSGSGSTRSVEVYPEWIAPKYPSQCDYHRIAIIDPDTDEYIMLDYGSFKNAVGQITKQTTVNVWKLKKKDPSMWYPSAWFN